MSDHAQAGDTGQNGDTAASPAVETTQSGETGAGATSAGTQSTENQPAMVPSGRLREEADKRRTAERELSEIREKLRALEGRQAAPTQQPAAGEDEPPAHLNARERARWIVEQDARQLIERELGMPLGDAKTLLTTTRTTAEDYAQRTWRESCQRHGLDPANREVQEVVSGLVQGPARLKLEDAFTRAARLYGKPTQAGTTGASVETTSQTGTMSGERIVPTSVQHAQELAEKGVTIAHVSSQELIRGAVDKEHERSGPQRIRTIH